MKGVNQATIIGTLGRDPETKTFQNGGSITSFSVAVNESWNDKNTGEKKERAEWHRISYFGKIAEVVGKYLKKGSFVYIEGSIHTRKWTDKEGKDVYTTEIIANEMQLLGGRDDGDSAPAPAPASRGNRAPAPRRPGEAAGYGTGGTPARTSTGFSDMDDDIPW